MRQTFFFSFVEDHRNAAPALCIFTVELFLVDIEGQPLVRSGIGSQGRGGRGLGGLSGSKILQKPLRSLLVFFGGCML